MKKVKKATNSISVNDEKLFGCGIAMQVVKWYMILGSKGITYN